MASVGTFSSVPPISFSEGVASVAGEGQRADAAAVAQAHDHAQARGTRPFDQDGVKDHGGQPVFGQLEFARVGLQVHFGVVERRNGAGQFVAIVEQNTVGLTRRSQHARDQLIGAADVGRHANHDAGHALERNGHVFAEDFAGDAQGFVVHPQGVDGQEPAAGQHHLHLAPAFDKSAPGHEVRGGDFMFAVGALKTQAPGWFGSAGNQFAGELGAVAHQCFGRAGGGRVRPPARRTTSSPTSASSAASRTK